MPTVTIQFSGLIALVDTSSESDRSVTAIMVDHSTEELNRKHKIPIHVPQIETLSINLEKDRLTFHFLKDGRVVEAARVENEPAIPREVLSLAKARNTSTQLRGSVLSHGSRSDPNVAAQIVMSGGKLEPGYPAFACYDGKYYIVDHLLVFGLPGRHQILESVIWQLEPARAADTFCIVGKKIDNSGVPWIRKLDLTGNLNLKINNSPAPAKKLCPERPGGRLAKHYCLYQKLIEKPTLPFKGRVQPMAPDSKPNNAIEIEDPTDFMDSTGNRPMCPITEI